MATTNFYETLLKVLDQILTALGGSPAAPNVSNPIASTVDDQGKVAAAASATRKGGLLFNKERSVSDGGTGFVLYLQFKEAPVAQNTTKAIPIPAGGGWEITKDFAGTDIYVIADNGETVNYLFQECTS